MNPLFASGLFDSPWMVAIIIIVGAISNWVTKRRQEKQAEQPPEGDEPAPTASKPTGGLNLEETLRRLMGEEPAPAPPRIPRAVQVELPPVAVAQASSPTITASEQQVQAARRFEQLNEQGRHPATVLGRGRENRSPAGKRAASRWCDPRSARQAFVGSIVFAPPKSLEP